MARIRTDPGLSNSQLADDPILEHSTVHQSPWDPPGCAHASVHVSFSACVYRHVNLTDVCISVYVRRHTVVQTSVFIYGMC